MKKGIIRPLASIISGHLLRVIGYRKNSLVGGILNNQIKTHIIKAGLEASVSIDATNILLDPDQQSSLPGQAILVLKDGLTSG